MRHSVAPKHCHQLAIYQLTIYHCGCGAVSATENTGCKARMHLGTRPVCCNHRSPAALPVRRLRTEAAEGDGDGGGGGSACTCCAGRTAARNASTSSAALPAAQ